MLRGEDRRAAGSWLGIPGGTVLTDISGVQRGLWRKINPARRADWQA